MQLDFSAISTDIIPDFFPGDIQVSILRLDKIHPVIAGNKYFKLRYYLEEAQKQQKKKIITMGGAWSNHIVATAAACQMFDLSSVGIIRGERPSQLSDTLVQAAAYGMELHFMNRENYREKTIPPELQTGDTYVIPEGGYGATGATGASEILQYTKESFSHCLCAVGTGTMLAGLVKAAPDNQQLIGVSVMKNNHTLKQQVQALLGRQRESWDIIHDYHFGGYARYDSSLIDFMNSFFTHTRVPSDFVYTGKLFFAVSDLARSRFFPSGSSLLIIHSGGLQGNSSLRKGSLIY